MAVKQKAVDCLSPSNNEARLQIILRALQDVTSQAQEMQDNMCDQIVRALGTVAVPKDPDSYMQFISDINSIKEILAKKCVKGNLVAVTLDSFYNEISTENRNLSPAMSIVLQLIDVNYIPTAVDLIFRSAYPVHSFRNAFMTLCTWLTKWNCTDNLGPLVIAFIKGLQDNGYEDILLEVTLATIEPLFKLVILADNRKIVGPVVLLMLSKSQFHIHIYLKIEAHVPMVAFYLAKEKSDDSLCYLQEIVGLSYRLSQRYPELASVFDPIKEKLKPFTCASGIAKSPNRLITWTEGANDVQTAASPGKVGLTNLGNTCYMNSVLQALFMTKPFRNELLLYDQDMLALSTKLQTLFALLQFSKKTSLSPNDILTLARPPGFLPGHQHDSSEFLGYLLDVLHEQEKNTNIHCVAQANPDLPAECDASATIVQRAFGGRTLTVSSCGQCGNKSERVDKFRELQLAFPTNSDDQSVQTLFEYYLQPEKLSGDNQYHCDRCEGLTDGERVTGVQEAPPRLVLTLKHFRYDPASQQRTKLLQSVRLDNQVNVEGANYELYAAVVHYGFSVDSGHYYTFAKEGEDWFKFNDGFVTRSNSDELYSLKSPETPYILFYRRQDCEDPVTLGQGELCARLQAAISKDFLEFEAEKARRPVKTYNTRQKRNDEPPPGGCGGGGFSNNSNMFVC